MDFVCGAAVDFAGQIAIVVCVGVDLGFGEHGVVCANPRRTGAIPFSHLGIGATESSQNIGIVEVAAEVNRAGVARNAEGVARLADALGIGVVH